jgi:hypothetical protein
MKLFDVQNKKNNIDSRIKIRMQMSIDKILNITDIALDHFSYEAYDNGLRYKDRKDYYRLKLKNLTEEDIAHIFSEKYSNALEMLNVFWDQDLIDSPDINASFEVVNSLGNVIKKINEKVEKNENF